MVDNAPKFGTFWRLKQLRKNNFTDRSENVEMPLEGNTTIFFFSLVSVQLSKHTITV